jgi:hypothetical protein
MARESMSDAWRLLLIDDNPDDRLFVRRALTCELDVLEVQEAGDPETLARALEAGPFDLVITDYALGFTDGLIRAPLAAARQAHEPSARGVPPDRGRVQGQVEGRGGAGAGVRQGHGPVRALDLELVELDRALDLERGAPR